MRASRVIGLVFIVFVATPLGAETVRAQADCSLMTSCPAGEHCLFAARFTGGMGICAPVTCAALTDATGLTTACFGPLGDTPREAFRGGDCDGDLVPNGMEPGALCNGGAVISLAPTGRVQWHTPQRYDVRDGGAIAPRDATSNVTDAIGIGCNRDRPCPILPSGRELASRCVYLARDATAGEIGVCTYYVDDRDDRSCLDTTLSGEACLEVSGEPNERWEHGDCDGDGLINKLDPHVCAQLEVVGLVSDGFAACARGNVDTSRCASDVGEIASDRFGCAEDFSGAAFAPFAYCCRSSVDCPMPAEVGSPSRARCVFLADDPMGNPVGACTYDGTFHPDDDSCHRLGPPLAPTCFSEGISYSAWANGACDLCDRSPNYTDDVVCSDCTADAGAAPDADAGEPPQGDAAVEPLDANVPASIDAAMVDAPGLDAATRTPASFAGSGCRCSLAHRAASSRAIAFLACLGVALSLARRGLARRGLGRRRQR